MENETRKTAILIPGANPEAAKSLFTAIKTKLNNKNIDTIELEFADQELLASAGKKNPSKILIGKSYGGRLAVNYQLRHRDSLALILLAPAMRPNSMYTDIDIPVLIVHGTDDTTIPIENSKRLFKYFKKITLEEIFKADHGFRDKISEVVEVISDWLDALVG